MQAWDEVSDPEWLIGWSMAKAAGKVHMPYQLGMFSLKKTGESFCDEPHRLCLDSPANTERWDHVTMAPLLVETVENGRRVGLELLEIA